MHTMAFIYFSQKMSKIFTRFSSNILRSLPRTIYAAQFVICIKTFIFSILFCFDFCCKALKLFHLPSTEKAFRTILRITDKFFAIENAILIMKEKRPVIKKKTFPLEQFCGIVKRIYSAVIHTFFCSVIMYYLTKTDRFLFLN